MYPSSREHMGCRHMSVCSTKDTSYRCSERSEYDDSGTTLRDNGQTSDESIFSDGSCGEPMAHQELVLDFSPTEEDEESREKCFALWDMIRKRPDFDMLFELPHDITQSTDSRSSDVQEQSEKEVTYDFEGDAVKNLNLAQEQGYIERALESKLPQVYCTFDGDYCDKVQVKAKGCVCIPECRSCCTQCPLEGPKRATAAMCREMRGWDKEHPKNMDPPGHPPELGDYY